MGLLCFLLSCLPGDHGSLCRGGMRTSLHGVEILAEGSQVLVLNVALCSPPASDDEDGRYEHGGEETEEEDPRGY